MSKYIYLLVQHSATQRRRAKLFNPRCFVYFEVKTELGKLVRGGGHEQQLYQMQRQCMPTGTTNSLKIAVTVSPPPPQRAATAAAATRSARERTGGCGSTGCGVLCGRRFRCRHRSELRAEKELCLETANSRRDSCASRTTQRSYADGTAAGAVWQQQKHEPRKNGLHRTMTIRYELDSSPENAELLARADGVGRRSGDGEFVELESAEPTTTARKTPNGNGVEGDRRLDRKTTPGHLLVAINEADSGDTTDL